MNVALSYTNPVSACHVSWTIVFFQTVIPSPKYLRIERLMLEDFTRLELDLADPGLAVLSGALVEDAVDILQALSKRLPVVGIDLDDAIAGDRCRRFFC